MNESAYYIGEVGGPELPDELADAARLVARKKIESDRRMEPAPIRRVKPPAVQAAAAVPRSAVPRPGRAGGPATLAASLSVALPGAGHCLTGRRPLGLAYLTGFGLVAAIGWALIDSTERLTGNLPFLGIPGTALAIVAVCLFWVAAFVHALNVASVGAPPLRWHRAVPGIASAFVPGWGQLLNGRADKAAGFVLAVWLLAFLWLAGRPFAQSWLAGVGLPLPSVLGVLTQPVLLYTATGITWTLAVYDAAMTGD